MASGFYAFWLRGTAASFATNNPTIKPGQPTIETDTNKIKFNLGTSDALYNTLSYWSAAGAGALLAVNNLSDLASAAAARANLGVDYGATATTVAVGNDSRLIHHARGMATTNLAVATALVNGLVVDGVTYATGDEILLTGQTTASENGSYIIAASGAASRAAASIKPSTAWFIAEGTVHAGELWRVATTGTIVVGTTALSITQANYTKAEADALLATKGDFNTGLSTSVDSEVVLFSGTGGKTGKRATGTGIAKLTSGVLSIAASGSDFAPPTSGSSSLKGNGSGGFAAATLNDNGAPTADFAMASHKLTGLLDGSAAQDSATMHNLWALATAEPPSLHGLKGWAYPISAAGATTIVGVAGTVYFAMVYTPVDITVANLWVSVASAAGAGLTAAGFALYSSAGVLLQSTVATTGTNLTQYQSVGGKSMPVTSQAFNAGDKFYVAFFFTGTTMPTLARGANATAIYNLNLAAPNLRFGSADTGRTTSFPATMGTQSGATVDYWAGVS